MRTSFSWEGKGRCGSLRSWTNAWVCTVLVTLQCEILRQRVLYLCASIKRLYQVNVYVYPVLQRCAPRHIVRVTLTAAVFLELAAPLPCRRNTSRRHRKTWVEAPTKQERRLMRLMGVFAGALALLSNGRRVPPSRRGGGEFTESSELRPAKKINSKPAVETIECTKVLQLQRLYRPLHCVG